MLITIQSFNHYNYNQQHYNNTTSQSLTTKHTQLLILPVRKIGVFAGSSSWNIFEEQRFDYWCTWNGITGKNSFFDAIKYKIKKKMFFLNISLLGYRPEYCLHLSRLHRRSLLSSLLLLLVLYITWQPLLKVGLSSSPKFLKCFSSINL